MRERSFSINAVAAAPPASVFAVLADAAHWSDWAGPFVPRSVLETPGRDEPNGVGAVRRLGAPPFCSREEIVEFAPPARLAYMLRSGLPVRDYRSVVDLSPNGTGTALAWHSTFRPVVPGTGPLLRWALRAIVGGFARRLVAYAPGPS